MTNNTRYNNDKIYKIINNFNHLLPSYGLSYPSRCRRFCFRPRTYMRAIRRNTTRSDDSTLAQPPPHGMRGCPNSRSPSGTELGPRQSKTCGRNNAQTRASLSATDSNSADMADHAPQPQHATRSSRMENQAASAGSAARQRTTTRPTRRDSREHPNAAHLSHLQEATSISHSTSSSGVYFTFGNSDNTR